MERILLKPKRKVNLNIKCRRSIFRRLYGVSHCLPPLHQPHMYVSVTLLKNNVNPGHVFRYPTDCHYSLTAHDTSSVQSAADREKVKTSKRHVGYRWSRCITYVRGLCYSWKVWCRRKATILSLFLFVWMLGRFILCVSWWLLPVGQNVMAILKLYSCTGTWGERKPSNREDFHTL